MGVVHEHDLRSMAAKTLEQAWAAIHSAYRANEAQAVTTLAEASRMTLEQDARIRRRAMDFASNVREQGKSSLSAESFLSRYGLAKPEGVVLMCLAEALLRIPDERTADELIRDKLAKAEWEPERFGAGPLLLNAPSWGLLLTGKLAAWRDEIGENPLAHLKGLIARSGEPLVRAAIRQAMQIMAKQFVIGQTIEEALQKIGEESISGRTYSFDMLGEAARTRVDAERYRRDYARAIHALGLAGTSRDCHRNAGISIKLSALHPRYQIQNRERVLHELTPVLLDLARLAKSFNLPLTIDAEESDRLTLSLELFRALMAAPDLDDWPGLGMAVQAYQKRAFFVIDWLALLASQLGRRMTVRLVKGAYWDAEIKTAQQNGVADYPVFTRKAATDVSYIACARKLLAARPVVYPQFATHNSRTLATILELAEGTGGFEFQKLYGMGDALHRQAGAAGVPCRVYAPVGQYKDLLPYLVRRMLENGANSSFIHQINDPSIPLESLVADPVRLVAPPYLPNPRVPLPSGIFPDRKNSGAFDLSDGQVLDRITQAVAAARAASAQEGDPGEMKAGTIVEPADIRRLVGKVPDADEKRLEQEVAVASRSAASWQRRPLEFRATCLERAADIMEERALQLMVLCIREGGKTLPDALAEVREAVDFCRYYALCARRGLAAPVELSGPTGEINRLSLHGRGVFACISPWNFPLAIFTGQVAAALVTGNAVIAKPAEQTPLTALAAASILHEAGIPAEVLRIVPGPGETIGAQLVADPGIAGVVFTGSAGTARAINMMLAARPGPILPLIAETGGQNAMIVDASALPEQVVADCIISAFQSAGQRCSALRLLFLQDDIAPQVVTMLHGAMHELTVGDPALPQTDVGPVIDAAAKAGLMSYMESLKKKGKVIAEVALPEELLRGHYVPPIAVEIGLEDVPRQEVFGPVLHVIRFRADEIDRVLEAIRNTGYALTMGIQSRIDRFVEKVTAAVGVGNTYVNRNMIGAMVGVQPFGGERLSGTGPKAGGPHYLSRFVVERTLTVNTAAVGGDVRLLAGAGL